MRRGQANGHPPQRELGDVLALVLQEQAGSERYRRRQAQVRRGRTEPLDRARPLEFDESGFPIAQRTPSFVTRVARLMGSS
jgi:hypothetical protein